MGVSVLDAGWDSVRQREELRRYAPGRDAPVERLPAREKADIVGRLRWDVVQAQVVFLTYPQLLDGAAFAALSAADLVDLLAVRAVGGGGVLPVRVNARDADLGGQLTSMLSAGFRFSSLSVPDADCLRLGVALAERAAARPAAAARHLAEDGPVEAARRMLLEADVLEPDLVRRTVGRWSQWLDLAEGGQLRVGPLRPVEPAALRPPQDGVPVRGAAGGSVLDGWASGEYDVGGLPNRSRVYAALDHLRAGGDAMDIRDAEVLRAAIDDAYYRAIAAGEGCPLRLRSVRPGVRRRRARQADPERVVLMPTHFERRLGAMTADEWQGFTDEAAQPLATWWAERAPAALQEVADLLGARTPEPPSRDDTSPRLTRVRGMARWVGGQSVATAANGAASLLTSSLLGGAGTVSALAAGGAGHLLPEILIAVTGADVTRIAAGHLTGLTRRYDLMELPAA